MTKLDRTQAATRLFAWAESCPSVRARSVVPEMADIWVAARDAIELIEALSVQKGIEEQARTLGQLEVLLFDELADRLSTLRPKLEAVAMDLSDAAG